MNSHTSTSKARYERMYAAWHRLVGQQFYDYELTVDELKEIAASARPPR